MSSILEAIRQGEWDFEPQVAAPDAYPATSALPGSTEKVGVLADRAASGLPLWHPQDCRWYADVAADV